MTSDSRQVLLNGLEEIGLRLDQFQVNQLLNYLELLLKWNSSYNLVADSDSVSMVNRHLLDSLSIYKYISGERVLDIGSGAGLPGIPLAIIKPQQHFVLLDSNGKKTRFLFQVKTTLKLDNVTIENSRIEQYQCPDQVDMVTCRAFATLDDIVIKSKHLLTQECKLLAMKGRFPELEINSLPPEFVVTNAVKLQVPGEDSERYLIEVSPCQGS